MKNLTKLNGSVITENERETSERRFIRYYSQRDDKPQRLNIKFNLEFISVIFFVL
jgi:hypothetical protein